MAQQDQSRPDTNQRIHIHLHHCICTAPMYTPYRAPFIQYVQPTQLRPYNLSQYQYPSYTLQTYALPTFTVPINTYNAITTAAPAPIVQSHLPEPNVPERRPDPIHVVTNSCDEIDEHVIGTSALQEFSKFLIKGCNIAEKIALRNQHRPCYKNIQNLCNRTKNELQRYSHTISNIHSQGTPWASKDFIYAYIRLINCWHMMNGYIESRGNLGSIDQDLSDEFKVCFKEWEEKTKDLAEHMITIFAKLDKRVCNPEPAPKPIYTNRKATEVQENPDSNVRAHDTYLHRGEVKDLMKENAARAEVSDESDFSGVTPGNFNFSKMFDDDDSDEVGDNPVGLPSPPSTIQFLDNAKNVGFHYKKKDLHKVDNEINWRNAVSASSSLIREKWNINQACGDSNCDDRKWANYDANMNNKLIKDARGGKKASNTEREEFVGNNKCMPANGFHRAVRKPGRDFHGMKVLLVELENTEFGKILFSEQYTGKHAPVIRSVYCKYYANHYKTPSSLVYDLNCVIRDAKYYFKGNLSILKKLQDYCIKKDELLFQNFPDLNFDELSRGLENYSLQ